MRARNIKPGFWDNEVLGAMPDTTRLLFIGLWCMADREGRMEYRPDRIRRNLFGYQQTPPNIHRELTVLARGQFIKFYRHDNKTYLHIPGFAEHQNPHHTEAQSKMPEPKDFVDALNELTVNSPLRHGEYPADSLNPDSLNPEDKDISRSSEVLKDKTSSDRSPVSPKNGENGHAPEKLVGEGGGGELETSSHREEVSKTSGPTPEQLVALWNDKAHPNCPRVKIVTDTRRKHAKARLTEHPELGFWQDVLAKVNRSPLLTGQLHSDKHPKWTCHFDWVMNPNNLAKIVEGTYDAKARR